MRADYVFNSKKDSHVTLTRTIQVLLESILSQIMLLAQKQAEMTSQTLAGLLTVSRPNYKENSIDIFRRKK